MILALVHGCSAVDSAAARTGPSLDAVTYSLRVGAWAGENDGGWQVAVESAWLTAYSASLVQCADIVGKGHAGPVDPSATPAPVVVDLAAPATTTLASVDFPAAAYCRVHWAVAGAPAEAVGLGDADGMLDLSLRVTGTASRAGTTVAFDFREVEADALLLDLEELAAAPALDAAHVEIAPDLGGAFSGVDFAAGDEARPAWTVLRNLVGGAEVGFSPGEGAG